MKRRLQGLIARSLVAYRTNGEPMPANPMWPPITWRYPGVDAPEMRVRVTRDARFVMEG